MLMSHLACADEPDHPLNRQQLAAFHEMTDGTGLPRSLAATGRHPSRARISLRPDAAWRRSLWRPAVRAAERVVTLSLPVIQTREVAPGETVGYACAWEAEAPSLIATLAAGYADGLMRSLSGKAMLWDGDTPCPLVGRVSMDMITVDVTHLPEVPRTLDILWPASDAWTIWPMWPAPSATRS
jgi:alanine racemase